METARLRLARGALTTMCRRRSFAAGGTYDADGEGRLGTRGADGDVGHGRRGAGAPQCPGAWPRGGWAASGAHERDHRRSGRSSGSRHGGGGRLGQHRRDGRAAAWRKRVPGEGARGGRGRERLRQARGIHPGAGAGRARIAHRAHLHALRTARRGRGAHVPAGASRERAGAVGQRGGRGDQRWVSQRHPTATDRGAPCAGGDRGGRARTGGAGERGRGAGHARLWVEGRHRNGESTGEDAGRGVDGRGAGAEQLRRCPACGRCPRGAGVAGARSRNVRLRRERWRVHHDRGRDRCAPLAPQSGAARAPRLGRARSHRLHDVQWLGGLRDRVLHGVGRRGGRSAATPQRRDEPAVPCRDRGDRRGDLQLVVSGDHGLGPSRGTVAALPLEATREILERHGALRR